MKKKNEKVIVEEQEIEETSAIDTLHPGTAPMEDPRSRLEYMTAILGKLAEIDTESLTQTFQAMMASIGQEGAGVPNGVDAQNKGTIVAKPSAAVGSATKEELDVILADGGEGLSEDFKSKASTLFESALNARIILVREEIQEEFEGKMAEELNGMVEKLDAYLDYVVEQWMGENEIAIESAVRNEMAESFMDGLKQLLEDHYFEVPEEKVEVLEALAAKVDDLESKLDEAITENRDLNEAINEAIRESAFDEISDGLALTQVEKLKTLAESVVFEGDVEKYKAAVKVIREAHFSDGKPKDTPNFIDREVDAATGESSKEETVVSPDMQRYVAGISKTLRHR